MQILLGEMEPRFQISTSSKTHLSGKTERIKWDYVWKLVCLEGKLINKRHIWYDFYQAVIESKVVVISQHKKASDYHRITSDR